MYGVIYALVIIGSFVNGWGNALLFVCASSYVNDCANDQNKGLFNSLLLIFNQGTFITGNLIAAFVIPLISKTVYFYICLGILCFTAIFYLLLKNPLPQIDFNEDDMVQDVDDEIDHIISNADKSVPKIEIDNVDVNAS